MPISRAFSVQKCFKMPLFIALWGSERLHSEWKGLLSALGLLDLKGKPRL